MARRRPLHTCASTCVRIAQRACKKVQDLDGPLGSTSKRAMNSFLPKIYTILYPILTILSIIDDHILTFQTKIEKIVPQSTYVFDKIDVLVCSAESLPQQLDNMFTKIPSMIPLFDWILLHLISGLNLVISVLTHLGSKKMREKEMRADMNSRTEQEETGEKTRNDGEFAKGLLPPKGMPQLSVKRFHSWKSRMRALEEPHYAGDSPMYISSYQSALSSPVSDSSPDAFNSAAAGKADTMSCSYKEILERGTKDDED